MANEQSVTQTTAPKPNDHMLSAFQSMAQQDQSGSQSAPSAGQVSTSGDPMLDAFKALKDNPDADAKKAQWVPKDDESVAEIRTSDGQPLLIHGEDLAEAQRRDPSLKILSQPQSYRDYARGRTLENMTRAMSGQPMARREDQAEAEKGRRAGTIAGGVQIATGALGGLFTPGVQVAQETSSLLGPEGQPIVKEVVKDAPSAIGQIMNVLPKSATVEQALKIAHLAYKLGIGAGGAAVLWHEFFGVK